MPVSIISADIGSMPKVTGISSAIPAEGPMPGRWLIIVPINTPASVYRTCVGVAAIASPCKMPCRLSIATASEWEDALGHRNAKQLRKKQIEYDGNADCDCDIGFVPLAVEVAEQT